MSARVDWAEGLAGAASRSQYDTIAGQFGDSLCINVEVGSTSFARDPSCNVLDAGVQISEMVSAGKWVFASAIADASNGHELYFAEETGLN